MKWDSFRVEYRGETLYLDFIFGTPRKQENRGFPVYTVSFSRKTATRKKNVDLPGIGHPLIDALLDFYKSESVSGELLNVKCDDMVPNLTARYLFIIAFEDGTRREMYQSFLIDGKEELSDLDFLLRGDFKVNGMPTTLSFIEDKMKMFTQNQEAKIRSNYDGVINVRQKCVGIQAIS